MKPVFEISLSTIKADKLLRFINDTEIKGKEEILNYMKNAKSCGVSSATVVDVFTGEDTGIVKHCYADQEYGWTSDTIYYFEKYNLALDKGFIHHVLDKRR